MTLKGVSCGTCGKVLVSGPGTPEPIGICVVCLKARQYKANRGFRRRTAKWIREAETGKLRETDQDPFRGFRED